MFPRPSWSIFVVLLIAALIAQEPAGLIDWLSTNPPWRPYLQDRVAEVRITPTRVPASPPTPQLPLTNEGPGLQADLERDLAGTAGTYGIAVVNLDDGSVTAINGAVAFPTASMYKLLVVYRVFQAIERGDLALTDRLSISEADEAGGPEPAGGFAPGDTPTVAEALDRMITVSSNAAAYALTEAVGGWGPVTSAAGELGMSGTGFGEDFYGTPLDFARFFHRLADQDLISASASRQMLGLLSAQSVNDRIPALLPAGTTVAHKTGEKPGVRNDGGIVQCAGGRYVIVLMSEDVDPATAVATEAQLSRTVYTHQCG